jgi:hypothetical protein
MVDPVKEIIMGWKKEEEELSQLFSKKKVLEAKKRMVVQIDQFKRALLICNDQKIDSTTDFIHLLLKMDYKPVNVQERLSFIEVRPNHYHSFIQLRACFHELEKINARKKVMERKKDQSED